ncbi:MAG: hypothetical protein NTU62_16335 [Spirochaetes bacterium]|nr:hypothetical protein [Spirochaetota bacterium]
MEELKSCLFCGKPVDRDYSYCPWCGYEFGPGDDVPIVRREPAPPAAAPADDPDPEPQPAPAETPGLGQNVLLRLTTLEELLSDMERELDLLLKTSSADP